MASPKEDAANLRIAEYISKKIDALAARKNQRDIAREAGYPNPNIISMIKKGETKIPLDRVLSLAKAIECPPDELFRLVLARLYPDAGKNPVDQIFNGVMPTVEEAKLISAIRLAVGKDHAKLVNFENRPELLEEIANFVNDRVKG